MSRQPTGAADFVPSEKRPHWPTQKALQTEVDKTRKILDENTKRLQNILKKKSEHNSSEAVADLKNAIHDYGETLVRLTALYEKDRWGELKETTNLEREYKFLDSAKEVLEKGFPGRVEVEKAPSFITQRSVRSTHSRSSTSSSAARRKAAAELAVAEKQAEFDRMIAGKEKERRIREAEERRREEEEQAQHELDMALLAADRAKAMASARLEAIEKCIQDEQSENGEENNPFGDDFLAGLIDRRHEDSQARVRDWVDSTPNQPIAASTPAWALKQDHTLGMLETFTLTNQRLVSGLTKQSLPKCHPDVFGGEVTLFHPWKRAFKAMISEADVTPAQEMNYLRNFTKGEVQSLVDNYRKRHHSDLSTVLGDLWKELERRFGNTAAITNSLLQRLKEKVSFSDKDYRSLQSFADLCMDISSQLDHLPGLSCLNYPNVMRPVIEKLPSFLRIRWEKDIVDYAEKHDNEYPGFEEFASMVRRQAEKKNHPNVRASGVQTHENTVKPERRPLNREPARRIMKTISEENQKHCKYHNRSGHSIDECKAFDEKTLQEKNEWVMKEKLCFRCFDDGHLSKDCKEDVTCSKCESKRHPTVLHKEREEPPKEIKTTCTSVCRTQGTSCSKIVLVDAAHHDKPEVKYRVYAIIDDQSNSSMIAPELADKMNINGPAERYYLSTCSGEKLVKYGRRATGILISANNKTFKLPTLVECSHIPQDKGEIPTPGIASRFDHLKEIANEIPQLDEHAKVQLLIGRDAPELLKVRAFRNGPKGAPWAQKLDLGWTISGQVCLNRVGKPFHVSAKSTSVSTPYVDTQNAELQFSPCPNLFQVKEIFSNDLKSQIKKDVFYTSPSDNEVDMSVEDRKFLYLMETQAHKDEKGNWELPLPFRSEGTSMPNNKKQAENRLAGLLKSMRRRPKMESDYFEFMGKILSKGHAVEVSTTQTERRDDEGNVWYLPHFGVYHPKKPNKIRVVFDSSAEFEGVSLNKQLLTGPDLANSLYGVLLRFREHETAAMCDVEQMFHSFKVDPKHRDFLRFLWYRNNDPTEEIIEYHMTVHLFGNGPSPAIATFGLRKTADDGSEDHGEEARDFVHENFYVDDGLVSREKPEDVVKLIKAAQGSLATANIRLHKVISNSTEVMEAFPADDRASSVQDLDLTHDVLPAQRSLGVIWNLKNDSFAFKVQREEKPFTRRGVLSVINSIYDPIGLAVPVTLKGKLLLQKLVLLGKEKNADCLAWDDPLPDDLAHTWQQWSSALPHLEKVEVPRCHHVNGFGSPTKAELHAFSDASQEAVGVVEYLRLENDQGNVNVSLLYGQSKVAGKVTSIPRLELCAAVMATQAVRKIMKEIRLNIDEVIYYTDSKVVLGYIENESRRFYVYVANRVQIIRSLSEPQQWKYIETDQNPADLATRGTDASRLAESAWLTGPEFLSNKTLPKAEKLDSTELSEDDPEVRKISTKATKVVSFDSSRFNHFSSWSSLVRAIALLIKKIRRWKATKVKSQSTTLKHGEENLRPGVAERRKAEAAVIKIVQAEAFPAETVSLSCPEKPTDDRIDSRAKKDALKGSKLYALDPFKDEDDIIRVGGRLRRASLALAEKHPIILPKAHHISELIIRHYHQQVHHQGRSITHGAVRQAGYWIISGHSAVTQILKKCIICKKARGKPLHQKMSDLPEDRVEPSPPFTNVGIDVFGPWLITTRKLRGGAANSKRWCLLFTCLSSRAIHIELLETMDASSFICALRRFCSLRGPVSTIKCDRGTNFVRGRSELAESLTETDIKKVQDYAVVQGCEWIFNPPHASHFGGVWERQIRTIRAVLDGMLKELDSSQLTHELLSTLMAEVSSIVNSRPITAIPTDADEPQPLTPAMLLTAKERPLKPPPGNFAPEDLYARRRWRRSQYLADQFWTRWRKEYLQNLQRRSKWQAPMPNLEVDDLVMIKAADTHRNNWPLGRVTKAIKSEDGKVRKAEVRRHDGKTVLRPVNQLVFLMSTKQD